MTIDSREPEISRSLSLGQLCLFVRRRRRGSADCVLTVTSEVSCLWNLPIHVLKLLFLPFHNEIC